MVPHVGSKGSKSKIWMLQDVARGAKEEQTGALKKVMLFLGNEKMVRITILLG